MAEDPDHAGRCQVSLLIPHSQRVAVLVKGGASTLPTFEMATSEPTLPEILARSLAEVGEQPPVLRVILTSGNVSGAADAAALDFLVEFEAGNAEPPTGMRWLDLGPAMIAELLPMTAQDAVESWAQERRAGWSALRPPWSRPGWLTQARTWISDEVAAYGSLVTGAPRQHQLWGVSGVLCVPTTDGDVYFKCSTAAFRHEAVVTQALAKRSPELFPVVIAVDAENGWMLMRDLAAPVLGDQDESVWHEGVTGHARIQRSWLDCADELAGLGLPNRLLTDLATEVQAMTYDTATLDRMPTEARDRWLTALPALVDSCLRLDELGPGPSLVHGDFHPWNVVFSRGNVRVFDWTDAALSHPFVDLVTFVLRAGAPAVRRQLVDAYVSAWSGVAPEESLREAASLGLVVGALYQVLSYRALLPTLQADGADDGLADADLHWMDLAVTCLEHGLETPTP